MIAEKISPDVILWDYDGTLVDSAKKNITITKEILKVVAPHLKEENLPCYLQNEIAYHEANHKAKNWQELYKNYYGLTEDETKKAGTLWTKYQLENKTPVKFFAGILNVLKKLKNIPHGICSQNSSENICKELEQNGSKNYFRSVIGYDDIKDGEQKPSPVSGIKCLQQIFKKIENKTIVYIGDHESDVIFARNLSNELPKYNNIYSVAVTYSGANISDWKNKPDFIISSPLEIISFISL